MSGRIISAADACARCAGQLTFRPVKAILILRREVFFVKKKRNSLRATLAAAHRALRHKRTVAAVYFALRFLVIVVMVAQFFNRDFESVFLCGLTLVLFLLPTVFERALMIDLPNTMEIIIMLFIFAAEILGEISSFYTTFKHWDTILHTVNGFLCAAIGFALVDMLNRTDKFSLSLSPVFMSIVAFCFSMTIGVLWEFFECAMDQLLFLDMQKDTVINTISSVMLDPSGLNNRVMIPDIVDTIVVTADGQQISLGLGGYLDVGILDTMKDLFVNFIGAAVFSLIGYFYVKSRGQGKFASRFIPQVLDIQPEDIDQRQSKIGTRLKNFHGKKE